MKTYSAKQFADVPAWQQSKSAKQAKKQANNFKRSRNAKRKMCHDLWSIDNEK